MKGGWSDCWTECSQRRKVEQIECQMGISTELCEAAQRSAENLVNLGHFHGTRRLKLIVAAGESATSRKILRNAPCELKGRVERLRDIYAERS